MKAISQNLGCCGIFGVSTKQQILTKSSKMGSISSPSFGMKIEPPSRTWCQRQTENHKVIDVSWGPSFPWEAVAPGFQIWQQKVMKRIGKVHAVWAVFVFILLSIKKVHSPQLGLYKPFLGMSDGTLPPTTCFYRKASLKDLNFKRYLRMHWTATKKMPKCCILFHWFDGCKVHRDSQGL